MARIQQIVNSKNERIGFSITGLIMPDGSRRAYQRTGPNAIRDIITAYKADRYWMKLGMRLGV